MNQFYPQAVPPEYSPRADAVAEAPNEATPPGALDIDVRQLWSALYRNRYLIAAVVAIALVLGMIVTALSTPTYTAKASVQIDDQASKVLETDEPDQSGGSVQDSDRFLQTQMDILNSRALRIHVAESAGLLRDDSFLIQMDQKTGDATAVKRREHVLSVLQHAVLFDIPRNSRIATISFESPDALLAARIANSFADNYIASNLQRKFDTSAYSRAFLEDQLKITKARLEESERASIAYARSAGLIDTSAGISSTSDGGTQSGPHSLTTSNLVAFNTAYTQARTARLEAQQRWEQALRTPIMNLPEVQSSAAVSDLQRQRALLQATYQQDLQRRRADYPAMQQQVAQLTEFDHQIATLADAARATIRDRYMTALKQEQALGGNVGALKGDTLAEQDRSIQYNILKREADTNRVLYDGLLQRYKEVSAAAGITANNISIIDKAEPPLTTSSPRPRLNLLGAGFAGFVIAMLIVFGREKLDDAVRSPEDVQRKLSLTFLNSIPLLPRGMSPHEALADTRSAMSEAYYALRTSLELRSTRGLPRSLLFTSSRQAEGKSTTAYAIARDFARIGKRVLLIDGDLRKPSLHKVLGLSSASGLASVLARHRTIEEVVQPTELANLSFMSCGPLPPNPAELLSGAMLPRLMQQLDQMYDLVVVDGPPVLGLADALLLGNVLEGTVFIIEANGSHHGHAKAAVRRLVASNVPILGAVLSKFDARKIGYGDEYGYSYSYSYSYSLDPSDRKG